MSTIRLQLLVLLAITNPLVTHASALDPASRAAQPSASAGDASFDPQFSADGSHLVFISHANNLVTNDDRAPWLDVFARNLITSNTVLVSVSATGVGGGNADSHSPSVSSNGQFIAFVSRASNLVPGDTNNADDIFVRDIVNSTTRLASVDANGSSPRDPQATLNIPLSGAPLISADGRWVFFESRATNLVSSRAPLGSINVYGRDLWSNVTMLVTVNTNGFPVADRQTLSSISANGRFAAFASTNNSFVAGITNLTGGVYVRDVQSNVMFCASTNLPPGTPASYRCSNPTLTESGTDVFFFVADTSNSGRLVKASVADGSILYTPSALLGNPTSVDDNAAPIQVAADGIRVVYQTAAGINTWVSDGVQSPELLTSCYTIRPALSRDGRFLACFEVCQNTIAFRFDLVANTNKVVLMPTTSGLQTPLTFVFPRISPDGGSIAFDSVASDLVPGDYNNASDVFLRHLDASQTELISAAHPGRTSAVGVSSVQVGAGSLSADGRLIAFSRLDEPAAYRDTNNVIDVYLADTVVGTSFALSINTNIYFSAGGGTLLAPSTNMVFAPVVNASGNALAALVPKGISLNGFVSTDVFVARHTNGAFNTEIRRVTRELPHLATFTGNSDSPSFSGDGQLLAFQSTSRGLTADTYPFGITNIFVHHQRPFSNGVYAGTNFLVNFLVSKSPNDIAGASQSKRPVISTDGRWITFLTQASNIVAGNPFTFPQWQCVVADLGTNRSDTNFLVNIPKHLVSYDLSLQPFTWTNASDTNLLHTNLNAVFAPIQKDVANSLFSGNQRYLFYALADRSGIYRHDLATQHTNVVPVAESGAGTIVATNVVAGVPNVLVCTNAQNISVSLDGNLVAFERLRAGMSNVFDLYVVDVLTGSETLVSGSTSGALANGSSTSPLITENGRYVIFQSSASDLMANDTNAFTDVFLRDRLLGVTMLVSANSAGRSGNGPSTTPVLSLDGRTAAFRSFASDLIPGDFNDKRDVFVLRLASADSDHDGIDDDWELTYFDELSRDGSGDFDNDGVTDHAEFLAGTDPKNDGSYFRVLTVTPLGGNNTRVMWTGNPTRNYRVEYKDDLSTAEWSTLDATIAWNANTATVVDPETASTNRFYRTVRLP